MRQALSALVLLALMAFAPSARAASPTCIAPPGTAAVEQYCENLPGAAGPERPKGGSAQRPRGGSAQRPRGGSAQRPRGGSAQRPRGGSASGGVPSSAPVVIDRRTGRPRRPSELESARATVGAKRPSQRSRDPRPVSLSSQGLSAPSGSVVKATRNVLGNGGEGSPALLWILVAIAVAMGAVAAWRHRTGSRQDQ